MSDYDEERYKNNLPYPRKPSAPEILRKRGSELTIEEANQVPHLRDLHEAELRAFEAAQDAYRAEDARLSKLFRSDIAEAHSMSGHPKESEVFNLAWEREHSTGQRWVWDFYGVLAELLGAQS